MNEIVSNEFGAVSTRFAQSQGPADDDLAAGVQGGYGLIGYRGKVWSMRYRGEERQLMRDDGDGPRGSIEVVILKASAHIAKIWYEKGYTEGSVAAPDCFSTNGITPDVGAANKQSPTCAACKRNVWGSRITPQGKQGKECSDSKRLAVVPLGDLANVAYGGPLLLRVPAASLQEMAQYGQKLQALGYPYYACATRVSFDPQEAYPKFVIEAIRALTDAEAEDVLKMRELPQVSRILAEATEVAAPAESTMEPATPSQTAALEFSHPASSDQPVEVSRIPAEAQPAPAEVDATKDPAYVAPAETQQELNLPVDIKDGEVVVGDAAFDAELDKKLGELLPTK